MLFSKHIKQIFKKHCQIALSVVVIIEVNNSFSFKSNTRLDVLINVVYKFHCLPKSFTMKIINCTSDYLDGATIWRVQCQQPTTHV